SAPSAAAVMEQMPQTIAASGNNTRDGEPDSLPRYSGGGLGRGFWKNAAEWRCNIARTLPNPLPSPPPEYLGREKSGHFVGRVLSRRLCCPSGSGGLKPALRRDSIDGFTKVLPDKHLPVMT